MIKWSKLFGLVAIGEDVLERQREIKSLDRAKYDPRFSVWDEATSMIISWLWHVEEERWKEYKV